MYKGVILGVVVLVLIALGIQLRQQVKLQARFAQQQLDTARTQSDIAARAQEAEQARRHAAGLDPTFVQESEPLAPEFFSVPNGPPREFMITVDTARMSDVIVSGHFDTSGSGKSGIEVYVFDEDAFSNWLDGNDSVALFDSGREEAGNVSLRLAKSGRYHLVFRNAASSSAMNVKSDIKLQYEKLANS